MPRYILETERLRLRELEAGDVESVREMLADPEARYIFRHIVAEADYAERWVERNRERYREHGFGLWAVETKDDGAFVGDCGITYQDVGGEQMIEVGYHLTHAARGHGYATEAATACLRYAFEQLGASRVVSLVDIENPASANVAEKIHTGRQEGLERHGRSIYVYFTDR